MSLTLRQMQLLADLPPARRQEMLNRLETDETVHLDRHFMAWAHASQLPPPGEAWRTWLLMGGRGFGKTRAGSEWICGLAGPRKRQRIALVGATLDEARTIMVEGRSGLLATAAAQGVALTWERSSGLLRWPGGTVAQIFSGESPEALRGPEHHHAWCDELGKWGRAQETWDNLQMGLRAGERPRCLVTTTPRPSKLLERLMADGDCVVTKGRMQDNINLPPAFVVAMEAQYRGTRLGRQELDGDYLKEVDGALFPRDLLARGRCAVAESYERIVVAVDPPASARGDACGIVVAGRTGAMRHVLADASVERPSPEQWARAVRTAFEAWSADTVVAEANQGGDMVRSVLRAAHATMPVRLVHARRGKSVRAEPIACGFEAGRIALAGTYPALEDELAAMRSGGGYEGEGRSPDRADAMVWALWALEDGQAGQPRVRQL
ncbi:terminase family protein [Sphingomicrobium sp. XHP0239]|uniref:DNA-packaging protein n=1 Tax=Sphingomicrobium maritimum TaxID=3133972 RepID=UPI0031CC7D91